MNGEARRILGWVLTNDRRGRIILCRLVNAKRRDGPMAIWQRGAAVTRVGIDSMLHYARLSRRCILSKLISPTA